MGKEISKILPGLYVGRLDNAQNDNDMMANCITHVLSVHEPVKQKLQKFNSFAYFEVNVKDENSACISKYFSKTNEFIHEARTQGGNVLIHCLAGVSRAPTVVLAYLMTIYDLNFQDSYNCLKALRPNIKPNAGFVKQLTEFEEMDLPQERKRMRDKYGIWPNYDEDKKLITDLINQFENRQNADYYIDSSMESSYKENRNNPLYASYENFINRTDDEEEIVFNDSSSDIQDPLSPCNDSKNLSANIFNMSPSPRSCSHSTSENEDEVDVPGSISIGNEGEGQRRRSLVGISINDYRGRVHSRTIDSTDTDPSLSRFGQTAPPSVPMVFTDTSR